MKLIRSIPGYRKLELHEAVKFGDLAFALNSDHVWLVAARTLGESGHYWNEEHWRAISSDTTEWIPSGTDS